MLLDDAAATSTRRRRARNFGHGHGLGQVGRPSDAGGGKNARETAELTNAIQRFFVENSRLGIPVIFHEECLHGQAAVDATSFPQPIGLGATFDPDLVERLFAMTAAEARARGTHQALTPVVDVARDPRWGRVEETFGEDPYLVAQLGVAAVRGFQGDGTFRDKTRVIATLKHFAAHGQPESGNNCAPVNVSERVLRETFLQHVPAQAIQRRRRDERHGLVQRDRRRPVARQPLAAARRAARRVGLRRVRRLRLLRDPRAGRAAGAVRPSRRRATARRRRCWPCGPA